MPDIKYISQVTLPGSGGTYNIKDASAWTAIGDLWSTIGQGALELVVLGPTEQLPTASESTKGKIYLKPDTTHNPSTNDVYDEYVTVKKGSDTNPSYVWEKIGNTDVNLSDYSLNTHRHTVDISIGVNSHSYTPEGTVSKPDFVGTSFNSTGSYTPKGTVATATTENKSATVSVTSGTATYTPAGSVTRPEFTGIEGNVSVSGTVNNVTSSGTAAETGGHTHSIGGTKKYLHSTSVPTGFSTTAVLTDVSTSKLNTTTITGTNGTIDIHDTPTLVTTAYGSASGWNKGSASNWTFSVAPDSEILTIGGGNGEAPSLTITNVSVGTSLTAGEVKKVAKVASSATTVATGSVSTGGTGATVAISAGSTTNAYTGINASAPSFTLNDTASGGSAVITSVNASTGSAGAHEHTVSVNVGSITVRSTGKFTPDGSISQPTFNGTGVRLVTGNIEVPATYKFEGTTETITVSGTATGNVSQPKFTGKAATLSHAVTGNGEKKTSAAQASA